MDFPALHGCVRCHGPLPAGRTRFCSIECSREFWKDATREQRENARAKLEAKRASEQDQPSDRACPCGCGGVVPQGRKYVERACINRFWNGVVASKARTARIAAGSHERNCGRWPSDAELLASMRGQDLVVEIHGPSCALDEAMP